MSERSETESERDLEGIEVVSEPGTASKRSSLRSGLAGPASPDRGDSAPAPHQVNWRQHLGSLTFIQVHPENDILKNKFVN